jgi:hypothetical protein
MIAQRLSRVVYNVQSVIEWERRLTLITSLMPAPGSWQAQWDLRTVGLSIAGRSLCPPSF